MSAPRKQASQWPELDKCDRNGYALVMHGLAAVVRIAHQTEDNKHALLAGQWLISYGEGILREKQAGKLAAGQPAPGLAPAADRDTILAELRGLYAKALPATLIVEAEPDAQSLTPDRMSQQPADS